MSDDAPWIDREAVAILHVLDRYAPLPQFLYEVAIETKLCRDTVQSRLGRLVAAGLVERGGPRRGFRITAAGRSLLSSLPANLLTDCRNRKYRTSFGRR